MSKPKFSVGDRVVVYPGKVIETESTIASHQEIDGMHWYKLSKEDEGAVFSNGWGTSYHIAEENIGPRSEEPHSRW